LPAGNVCSFTLLQQLADVALPPLFRFPATVLFAALKTAAGHTKASSSLKLLIAKPEIGQLMSLLAN
jgi:hypothetical protein